MNRIEEIIITLEIIKKHETNTKLQILLSNLINEYKKLKS